MRTSHGRHWLFAGTSTSTTVPELVKAAATETSAVAPPAPDSLVDMGDLTAFLRAVEGRTVCIRRDPRFARKPCGWCRLVGVLTSVRIRGGGAVVESCTDCATEALASLMPQPGDPELQVTVAGRVAVNLAGGR